MDTTTGESYFLRLLASKRGQQLERLAIVANRKVQSFLLNEVRNNIPTYLIVTFQEMRSALEQQQGEALFGLDLREMSPEDTSLLARCLGESRSAQAAVYILSPEQFSSFESDTFQFVYR